MSKKQRKGAPNPGVAAGLIRAKYAVSEVAGHGVRGHKEHKLLAEIETRLHDLILAEVNRAEK